MAANFVMDFADIIRMVASTAAVAIVSMEDSGWSPQAQHYCSYPSIFEFVRLEPAQQFLIVVTDCFSSNSK